jgi:hypothetical protein
METRERYIMPDGLGIGEYKTLPKKHKPPLLPLPVGPPRKPPASPPAPPRPDEES